MNSNTFLKRFGFNPNDFLLFDIEPITTDDGYIFLLEQNKDKTPCPFCQSDNIVLKEYYFRNINCSESNHIKDIFKIKVPRFKCKNCHKTFIKKLSNINYHSNISNNIVKMICNDFHICKTFDEIAVKYHISTAKVIDIFDNNIPSPKRLLLPRILCIDEFHFSSKNNENKYCVIIIDWETKQIIDIIKNRKLPYLREYFSQINEKERKNVQYFVSDLYDGYRTIHNEFFKKSQHIADFYHITIQLTRAVNSLRTSVMKQLDSSSLEYKFMKKHWKLFISRYNCKYDSKSFKTKNGIEVPFFDILMKCIKLNDNLWNGYNCIQDLFSIHKDQYFSDAMKDFDWISNKLENGNSSLLLDVAKTYRKWSIEISNAYAYHKGYKNISNSIAESTNNQIKTLIKVAYGYHNFERFRKRVLLLLRH